MLVYLSADWVFPVKSSPIQNGVICVDEQGVIQAVLSPYEATGIEKIKQYDGVLVPGFVNTHCHLELSHMKGKLEEKTGLTNFIKGVLSFREQPEEEIISAMKNADQEMFANGIVAVGDISNMITSRAIKLNSKLYYQTFVEVFGFNGPAADTIATGIKLREDFKPLNASIVPHAPYSVSSDLFIEIKNATSEHDLISIHNQETIGENELFETGTGSFANFFKDLGIAQSEAHNSGKNAINYHLPKLPKKVNTLLVHNTMSALADLEFAEQEHQQLYWCLCPNANLYIENALPDVELFKTQNVKITLGTDSLASNHQLNILAEMKTLHDKKGIIFEESLKWATLNGAEFLKIDSQYGSLEVGKKPGINLISLSENLEIESFSVQRLI